MNSFRRVNFLLPMLAVFWLGTTLLAGCGGGTVPTPGSPTSAPSSQPTGAATTVPIAQAGGSIALPAAGGLTGSITLPANNAPSGTTLTIDLLTGVPSGGPQPTIAKRQAQVPVPRRRFQTGAPTVLFSLELQVSQTVSFTEIPGFSLTLPSSIATAGEYFYIAAYQGTTSSAALLGTLGPASVNGQTISFAPTPAALTLAAGTTYLFELYDTTTPPASASPSPSPSPTSSPVVSASPGSTTTIAGNPGITGSSNGSGTGALFNSPAGVAFDPSNGSLYVADTANCEVRQVTIAGAVTTIAGSTHVCGYGGIVPSGIAYDATDGNLYVTNTPLCNVDQVQLNGTVTSIAGNALSMISPCSFGDGTGTGAHFIAPSGIAYDPTTTSLYVTDSLNGLVGDACAVRQVTTAGTVTTIAGGPSACGATSLNGPEGIAYDPDNGNLYVTDTRNCAIRQVTPAGVITAIAGNPPCTTSAALADGNGTGATFYLPIGITYDAHNGDLYVTDTANCAIRQVTIGGTVTTIAGNHVTCGQSPTWSDGVGASALFSYPQFITYDSSNGELYVTDTGNQVVREVTP